MAGSRRLLAESGSFRTVDVEIVNADGEVLHTGSRFEKVPRLVAELIIGGVVWLKLADSPKLSVRGAVNRNR